MVKAKEKYNEICAIGDYEELGKIRDFVKLRAELFGFVGDDINNICLAVDEACSNLIRHAFKFDKKRKICIKIESDNNAFIINVIDNGKPFNPLEITLPNMSDYIAKPRRGGLGIKIMRSLMDDISYMPMNDSNPNNILKLKKILNIN
jgi:serine/threonine-protein kinase RsbW